MGFFDEEDRLAKLSELGDSLEKLNSVIDWEMFRPILNKIFSKKEKGIGGRKPYDYVMMFKILILQRVYNLSDEQTEFQINDRMSFMRFLGMTLSDRVPDAKTIWLFRDTLSKAAAGREMFELFGKQLEEQHLITRCGTIVDASFVEAPKQRTHGDEYRKIKDGEVPEEWQKPENKAKLRQKDMDARHTRKGNKQYFGYKDNVSVDADSKLINDYAVTDAAAHDNQSIRKLLSDKDKAIYADSAYWRKDQTDFLPSGAENHIIIRATKAAPLTEAERKLNRSNSRIRCRVEHVFGYMTGVFHGLTLRTIGIVRAEFNIALTNLIYNCFRYEYLIRA